MQISDLLQQYNKLISSAADTSQQPATGKTDSVITKQLLDYVSRLTVGNIFAGTINDISNQEVTIGLSDGETIKAVLNSDVALNIGDSLYFQIKSNDGLQMEISPFLEQPAFNPTLLKALEAAGLTVNEKTLQMVQSMMEEQLPIDKNSLAAMAKTIFTNPEIDISTAVELTKFDIPVTVENASMLSNYKMDQGAVLNQLQSLIDEMLQQPAMSENDKTAFFQLQKELLAALLPETVMEDEKNAVIKIVPSETLNATASSSLKSNESSQNMNQTGLQSLKSESDFATIGTTTKDQINTLQTNLLANEVVTGKQLLAENEVVTGKQLLTENENLQANGKTVQVENKEQEIQKNPNQFADISFTQAQGTKSQMFSQQLLGSILSVPEQEKLAQQLQLLTGISASEIKEALNSSVTVKEFFHTLTEILSNPQSSFDNVKDLLNSDVYKKIIQNALQQQWMLQPQEVSGDHKISDLYNHLQEQMNQVQQVLNNNGQPNAALANLASDINSNIQFMNTINQHYAYVQIPLKMKGQNAQAELFVYTNHRNKSGNQEEFSAFLHLDLENLGSTDVSVKLKGKNVNTIFYLSDDTSYNLVLKYADVLQEKLQQKGYKCQITAKNDSNKVNLIQDFLQKDKPVKGEVHRYSFDVRA